MIVTRVLREAQLHRKLASECGYRTNRDVASSQVVLKRGLAAVGQIVKKSVEEAEDTKAPVKQKTQSAKKGGSRRRR